MPSSHRREPTRTMTTTPDTEKSLDFLLWYGKTRRSLRRRVDFCELDSSQKSYMFVHFFCSYWLISRASTLANIVVTMDGIIDWLKRIIILRRLVTTKNDIFSPVLFSSSHVQQAQPVTKRSNWICVCVCSRASAHNNICTKRFRRVGKHLNS